MEAARKTGRKLIVDPRGSDFARYAGADVVMPNRHELAAADQHAGRYRGRDRRRRPASAHAARLRRRGRDPRQRRHDPGRRHGSQHFPAEAADVYDTSGAGDTALATLGAALAAQLSLPVAVRLANLAAGISVGKVGASVVREADLLAALTPQRSALRKIVTREEAVEQAERWRHRGWRVGFTNGFFDLLHQGHIQLLEQARAACDRLIVGLNSDTSVRRQKGPPHPVQPEAARAAVLASFACVDQVCLFEEDTPEALIEALRPDA